MYQNTIQFVREYLTHLSDLGFNNISHPSVHIVFHFSLLGRWFSTRTTVIQHFKSRNQKNKECRYQKMRVSKWIEM